MISCNVAVDGLAVRTVGLKDHGFPELHALVATADLVSQARDLLLRLVENLDKTGRPYRDGETASQGMWLLKFVAEGDCLQLFEYDETDDSFVRGVTRTVVSLNAQRTFARIIQKKFAPPNLGQGFVVTEGWETAARFRLIRYPAPAHMSGWWMLTEHYEGSESPKKVIAVKDLLRVRPELMAYLAVEVGTGIVVPFWWTEEET